MSRRQKLTLQRETGQQSSELFTFELHKNSLLNVLGQRLQCVCMNRMTLSLKSFRLSADSDVEKLNGGPGGSLPVLVLDKSMRQKKRESWVGISTFETTDADSDSSLASLPGLQVDFPSKSECGNY